LYCPARGSTVPRTDDDPECALPDGVMGEPIGGTFDVAQPSGSPSVHVSNEPFTTCAEEVEATAVASASAKAKSKVFMLLPDTVGMIALVSSALF
jgi:hypothetical protein